MSKIIFKNNPIGVLLKSTVLCLAIVAFCGNLSAQYKGSAVKKEKLISVLRSKQLQTREIVAIVKSNGVDFLLTAAVQTELTQAGARPEVIEAVRASYCSDEVAKPSNVSSGKTKTSGVPLTKEAIITLLQNGAADVQVRKNVEARGVNFQTNPQIINEIKKARGSIALISFWVI